MSDECRILFGESKYHLSNANDPADWPFLAQRRGLPDNMSPAVTQVVQEALEHNATTMSTWGFTYLSYEEIAQVDWQSYTGAELDGESYGWGLLFSLMRILDNASKHQRLIVWFEWL